MLDISIHPPLAGRDTSLFVGFAFCSDFNPPAPCGAGPLIRYWAQMEMQFQSTRPLRGGTLTYAPSGERAAISIHPPLAGRDRRASTPSARKRNFNPPAPCGAGRAISGTGCSSRHFNPPAPCGAGLLAAAMLPSGITISIHPPLAGRDQRIRPLLLALAISIHPPLAGRDWTSRSSCGRFSYFNPPAPCGAGPCLYFHNL